MKNLCVSNVLRRKPAMVRMSLVRIRDANSVKASSPCGRSFPSGYPRLLGAGDRPVELQAQKVAFITVCKADEASLQGANGMRQTGGGRHRRHRDLQGEISRLGQAAARGQKDAAGTDIQGCSKLQEISAVLIHSAHKYGDGQRKARIPSPLKTGLRHDGTAVFGAHNGPNLSCPCYPRSSQSKWLHVICLRW